MARGLEMVQLVPNLVRRGCSIGIFIELKTRRDHVGPWEPDEQTIKVFIIPDRDEDDTKFLAHSPANRVISLMLAKMFLYVVNASFPARSN